MISVAANGNLFELCRHASAKSQLIGAYPKFVEVGVICKSEETAAKDWFLRLIKKPAKFTEEFVLKKCLAPVDELITYCEPNMREYPKVNTLMVRAQMKLGKTKTLRKYIDEHYPKNAVETSVIRFVTFRQTFSNSIKESFPDFSLYSDHTGQLDSGRYPKLIIQVESLHRLVVSPGIAPIQLLILDEVESIMEQFSSGLHKNFSASFAVFEWMIRTAERVICMDANLSARAISVIKLIRSSGTGMTVHLNTFKRAAEDSFYFTLSKGTVISKMYEYLLANKRIVIATNSLADAKTLYQEISSKFKGRVVRLYSSKTPQSEKKSHFGNVGVYWKELDVLIYTPTISAGISFELEHFDALFGLFTDKSCTVETCRQMLLRVRSLRDKKYFIYLNATFKNMPTDTDEIKRNMTNSRRALYDYPVPYSYNSDGSVRDIDMNTPYLRLWLENISIRNKSRNSFIRRFVKQVRETGATVNILESGGVGDKDALKEFKNTKVIITRAANEEIANAPDLTYEEANDIRKELNLMDSSGRDIDAKQLVAYEKFKLMDTFKWPKIDSKFVEKYNQHAVKAVYYNLNKIHAGTSLSESVELIRQSEANRRDAIWALYSSEIASHKDIQYTYNTNRHKIAVSLLEACGFRCLTDKITIYSKALLVNLSAFQMEIFLPSIKADFEISPNYTISKPDDRLKIVNCILRAMYGIELAKVYKTDYRIRQTEIGNLFEIYSGDGTTPSKPVIMSKLVLNTTPETDAVLSAMYTRFYDYPDLICFNEIIQIEMYFLI